MSKRQPFTAKPGDCEVCAAAGILPSQAIACHLHSVFTIAQLRRELKVATGAASGPARLHLAIARLLGAVPSTDGSEGLQAFIDQRDRLDRVEKLLQLVLAVAQWDDAEAKSLEAELFKKRRRA